MPLWRILGYVFSGTYFLCFILYRWEEKKNWNRHPRALEAPEPTRTMLILSALMWGALIAMVILMIVTLPRWFPIRAPRISA